MAFTLPKLPYAYEALEPYIDARTMEIHHTKHHNAYTTNLNAALAPAGVEGKSIEEILQNLDMNNAALRNNAGGYYNHNLFWEVMSPNGGGKPTGELAKAIDEAFGSFEGFKEAFSKAAATRFGSGWAWLCVHNAGYWLWRGVANIRLRRMGTRLLPTLSKPPSRLYRSVFQRHQLGKSSSPIRCWQIMIFKKG